MLLSTPGSAEKSGILDPDNLASNDHMRAVLAQDGLDRELFDMGLELAETAIDLFSDLSPDNPFFEQLNFMTPEQLEAYPPILGRALEMGFDEVKEDDRAMLMMLPFSYVEPRNRLKLLDDDIRARLLAARKKFHEQLPEETSSRINRYHIDTYNPVNSVRDNILFGRVAYGASNADDEIKQAIRELLVKRGLEDDIFRVGLDFDIGVGGKRLSENQRQRVVLARALLKGADLLIVNRGLSGVDTGMQERLIDGILKRARGDDNHRPFGVLWVLTTPELADKFDSVLVFERQKLVEKGTPDELAGQDGSFSRLVT